MKAAVVQNVFPLSNTTVDFTDPTFSGDVKGAIFMVSDATANDTATAQCKMMIGATDLTNNVLSFDLQADAALATTGLSVYATSATACVGRWTSGASINALGAYSATLSNGVRILFSSNDATAHLTNCLLLGGSDFEFGVGSANFLGTDLSKTITHNLTGTPDWVWLIFQYGGTLNGTNVAGFGRVMGFYDGTNSVGVGFQHTNQNSPTQIAGIMTNADMGHVLIADAEQATITLSAVGATTLTVNRSVTGSVTANAIVLCGRHTSGSAATKAFQTTLPTATGNAALVSGMSTKPQVLITVPTRLTTMNAIQTTDATGVGDYGVGVAANNGGTTQQMAAACSGRDAVTTTVCGNRMTATNALLNLTTDATASANIAVQSLATVSSWDSGGVTLNHSAVGASAFGVIGLAFGVAASTTPPLIMPTKTVIQTDTVLFY